MNSFKLFRMSLLTFLLTFIFIPVSGCQGPRKYSVPEPIKNFRGIVGGRVKNKQKKGFVLELKKVHERWSSQGNPKKITGDVLFIQPKWIQNGEGQWKPKPLHMAWIRSLGIGDWVSVSIQVNQTKSVHLINLTPPQKRQAQQYL
ncbi:MAG: hypothetical protein ABEJ65_02035 [bacterium]